jgi:hypothetical protein
MPLARGMVASVPGALALGATIVELAKQSRAFEMCTQLLRKCRRLGVRSREQSCVSCSCDCAARHTKSILLACMHCVLTCRVYASRPP